MKTFPLSRLTDAECERLLVMAADNENGPLMHWLNRIIHDETIRRNRQAEGEVTEAGCFELDPSQWALADVIDACWHMHALRVAFARNMPGAATIEFCDAALTRLLGAAKAGASMIPEACDRAMVELNRAEVVA